MPVNYQDTKIYKLVLDDDLDNPIYVGHTTEKYLSNRMKGHKKTFNQWKKGKKCKYSFFTNDLDLNKVQIVLVENYPCNNVAEARGKELEWIHHYKTKQTKPQPINIKGGTKEWNKEYEKLNKEEIKIKRKQKKPCEFCGTIINGRQMVRHQKLNCPKFKVKVEPKQLSERQLKKQEKDKKYRSEHPEEIKIKKATKKPCDLCGKLITAPHLPRHKRENCPKRNKTDSISIDDCISSISQENIYQEESNYVVD